HALAKRDQSGTEALAWLSRRGYRKALVLDRYDNFVLQRGEAVLADQNDGATSMELLFPLPVRIDERMDAAGEAVADSFIETTKLHNGATLRAATPTPSFWGRIFAAKRSTASPDQF